MWGSPRKSADQHPADDGDVAAGEHETHVLVATGFQAFADELTAAIRGDG